MWVGLDVILCNVWPRLLPLCVLQIVSYATVLYSADSSGKVVGWFTDHSWTWKTTECGYDWLLIFHLGNLETVTFQMQFFTSDNLLFKSTPCTTMKISRELTDIFDNISCLAVESDRVSTFFSQQLMPWNKSIHWTVDAGKMHSFSSVRWTAVPNPISISFCCFPSLVNTQSCPWECHSYEKPMGNVPWDETGINCYGMGMGQINMSHGQP